MCVFLLFLVIAEKVLPITVLYCSKYGCFNSNIADSASLFGTGTFCGPVPMGDIAGLLDDV
jgi:hypothetical protein